MWLLLLVNVAGKISALLVAGNAPATALALWFLPDALLAYHVFVPGAQGLLPVVRRFRTSRREVWLTIDDGPDPNDTPQILSLLAANDARATFFVIGESVVRYPELVRAIVAAGHEVAHHTQTHPVGSFWCASPARVRREIDAGCDALKHVGVTPSRFRAPVGIKSLWLAAALRRQRLTCVGWSARGFERRPGDAEAIAQRVTRQLEPGAILLLHEGPRVPAAIRVAAIGRVLERLRAERYHCVVPAMDQLSVSG